MTEVRTGMSSFQFRKFEDTFDVANVVVDGSPNASTVLTLTHWPGIAQPSGLGEDTSAEMAFRYVLEGCEHGEANVVTNNHFDQDGLVSAHILIDPEASLEHRDMLTDLAHAGDFGTYRFRAAARASMAIWAYAQPALSPLADQLDVAYPEMCALLYEHTLPLLLPLVNDPEHFRDLWNTEDEHLSASELAIADGDVTIEEVSDLDLAIVSVETELEGGHRFASDVHEFIHPMALHNATTCCRVLLMRGQQYLYRDRYETWVQYQSRSFPARRDMAPLAVELTAAEVGATAWTATSHSGLTPRLEPDQASSISQAEIQSMLTDYLRTAPAAWDPRPR